VSTSLSTLILSGHISKNRKFDENDCKSDSLVLRKNVCENNDNNYDDDDSNKDMRRENDKGKKKGQRRELAIMFIMIC
jgi:hypothetical protein